MHPFDANAGRVESDHRLKSRAIELMQVEAASNWLATPPGDSRYQRPQLEVDGVLRHNPAIFSRATWLTPGHRADHDERRRPGHHRRGQGVVGRLMRDVLVAGVEADEGAALPG